MEAVAVGVTEEEGETWGQGDKDGLARTRRTRGQGEGGRKKELTEIPFISLLSPCPLVPLSPSLPCPPISLSPCPLF